MTGIPEEVRLIEVGPRDGLQMERQLIATEVKVELILGLAEAGLKEIEATSFVHPRVIPQLADAEDVLGQVRGRSEVRWVALIPNLKGARRAMTVGVDEVRLVVAATESYNRKNVGLSIDESATLFAAVAELAARHNADATVILGVALGCPIEGKVPVERVASLAERFIELGASAIGVADSYGLANPLQVQSAVRVVQEVIGARRLWLHLHDTRGLGLANAFAAMQAGVDAFDVAFGGLGGTPIMKGASGNVATEDLVYMCSQMGIETGVDLDRVRAVSRRMEELLGRPLPSHLLRAGTHRELIARNRD